MKKLSLNVAQAKPRWIILILTLLALAPAFAAEVIPAARRVQWQGNVGVPGGIPNRTTIYTTLTSPTASSIASALRSCPPGQVVLLGPGTFSMSSGIDWSGVGESVVLRGATNAQGLPATRLVFGTGIINMRSTFSEGSLSTEANLTADAVKGSATINLGTVPSWVMPGHLYIIDQLDDTTLSINPGQESGTSYRQAVGNGARGMGQIGKVVSKTASTVTFEVPMYHPWSTALSAQIAQAGYNPTASVPRRLCGLENLILEATGTAGDNHMVRMENCDSCWIKNCEIANIAGGIAVKMDFSYRCEVRDSYIHDSHLQGAGQGYGVGLYSVSCGVLVENNIFRRLHVAMQNNYGSSGNVYAYNLCMEGISDSGQNPSFNAHGTTGFQTLVEGNYMTNKILGDFTHGAGALYTVFRNRVVGYDPGETYDQCAISIEKYERKWSVVGNILGSAGYHNQYEGVWSVTGCSDISKTIYKLGHFVNWGCSSSGGDSPATLDVLRALNWDSVNNAVVAGGFTSNDLANSYYLGGKPDWFGDRPWPPFDPFSPSKAYITNLPAGYRYVFGKYPPPGGAYNQAPTPAATATPSLGLPPLAVTFSSAGSSDPEGAPLTYRWDFGDGSAISTAANPGHTYAAEGNYDATLTVSDGTNSSVATVVIRVGNQPPSATITANFTSGTPPLNVSFSSAGSVDPEGQPLTYNWSFGDGTANSTVANPTHSYAAVGVYTARLVVSDGVKSATNSVAISVINPSSGLVAAYGFEEGLGNVLTDLSGNGNNGAITSGSWTNGRFGKALFFNGSGTLVTVNDSPSLALSTGMTIEAWVNPTALGGWRDVVYKANDIYFIEGSTPTGPPCAGGTFAGSSLYSTNILPLNVWTHLATTYDGATLRFYVNGVQVATRAQTGSIQTSADPLTIGGDLVAGQYWSGRIDEVRVYNRALSAAQILTDKNTSVTGLTAPSMVANVRSTPLN